ncbi:MAG: type 4a pilus biogenesis protein PilO [Desulfovermiculus sp.]
MKVDFSLLSKWQDLSLTRKIFFSSGMLLFIAAALWLTLFKPKVDKIQTLQQDIDSLDQTIATYQAQVQKLDELEERLAAQRKELTYAQTLLPETTSDAENLLSSIEKLGNDVGIDFLLFTPGKEKEHVFYASRAVEVRFQGTFHNLMRFFTHLSGLDRLVTLESVQLKPVSRAEEEGISLQADCQLNIYRMLSDQELGENGKKTS